MNQLDSQLPSPNARRKSGSLVAACAFAAVLVAPLSAQPPAAGADDVATVAGQRIDRSQLMDRASDQLENVKVELLKCQASAEENRHRALEVTVETMVREQLVARAAAAAGKDTGAWLGDEKARRLLSLSQEDVDKFFSENQASMQRYNRQQIESQVRDHLVTEAVFTDLKLLYPVDYLLGPYRVDVTGDGSPTKGAADAPVTIVEFSDFQCPYCQSVLPTLEQALAKYEGKVRLVFRQFPLYSIHPQAAKAAEASLCANDQGKFWAMHDLMFAEQKSLDLPSLKEKAGRLELDQAAFDTCLDSGRHDPRVRADVQAGSAIGVSGTPAMFINGRPYSGALSFEQLAAVIDEELEPKPSDR